MPSYKVAGAATSSRANRYEGQPDAAHDVPLGVVMTERHAGVMHSSRRKNAVVFLLSGLATDHAHCAVELELLRHGRRAAAVRVLGLLLYRQVRVLAVDD